MSESTDYFAVHRRLGAELGPARWCRCVDCGRQAYDWSYEGGDPEELTTVLTNNRGYSCTARYSLDPERYAPRCRPCHGVHDVPRRSACKRGHAFAGANVRLRDRGHRIERVCIACVRLRNAAYYLRTVA